MESTWETISPLSVRIAICDDSRALGGQLENLILGMKIQNLETEVYESGTELLADWEKGIHYQILLLDIEMPGIDGISLAKEIRKKDANVLMLFVSSHQEYVFDTFSAEPFRFVRKPVQPQEIMEDVCAALERLRRNKTYFYFRISKTQYQVAYDDIVYFEGNGRKVILHTRTKPYVFYGKVSEIMQTLDDTVFCQIHSSYIVNMNRILSISNNQVVLQDQTALPVSKARKEGLHRSHLNFMFQKAGVK